MNQEPLNGSCERIGLLLSLAADSAATPAHETEIAAHVPRCTACSAAGLVDAAVRRRLLERADAPAPSWLAGFAQRTASRAIAQAGEARTQNRLLWMSAAAAVVVAVGAQFALPGGALADSASNETASVHESTRLALLRSRGPIRAGEGK